MILVSDCFVVAFFFCALPAFAQDEADLIETHVHVLKYGTNEPATGVHLAVQVDGEDFAIGTGPSTKGVVRGQLRRDWIDKQIQFIVAGDDRWEIVNGRPFDLDRETAESGFVIHVRDRLGPNYITMEVSNFSFPNDFQFANAHEQACNGVSGVHYGTSQTCSSYPTASTLIFEKRNPIEFQTPTNQNPEYLYQSSVCHPEPLFMPCISHEAPSFCLPGPVYTTPHQD